MSAAEALSPPDDPPPRRVHPLPLAPVAVTSRTVLVPNRAVAAPGALAASATDAFVVAPAVSVPGVVLDVLGRGVDQGDCQREQRGNDEEEAAAPPHFDKVRISTVS